MAKRRTSGIQRRARASESAMSRRVGEGGTALDWRILLIGGILVVGAIVLIVVVLFAQSPNPAGVGTRMPSEGSDHVADGTAAGPYNSVPATSGAHWGTPASWGVYTAANPAIESQVIHNLEHGGMVIWYTSDLEAAGVQALEDFVRQQNRGAQFKIIVSPWSGADFGHPVAVTSWNWLLYLDTADLDAVRQFIDAHYGDAPEPFGGPDRPPG